MLRRLSQVGIRSSGSAGEGQEDLVEGGAAQGDVVDADAGAVEGAHGVGQQAAPPSTATARLRVAGSSAGRLGAERREQRRPRGQVVAVPGVHLDDVAPGLRLELVGGAGRR